MATKKARSSSEKQLKATIRKLEARLERADARQPAGNKRPSGARQGQRR